VGGKCSHHCAILQEKERRKGKKRLNERLQKLSQNVDLSSCFSTNVIECDAKWKERCASELQMPFGIVWSYFSSYLYAEKVKNV